jgi:membrane protein YdbS with pleckstrin-like domain
MAAPLPDKPTVTEEVDVWWGAYASRTMLPSFLVCLFVTLFLLGLDWYLRTRNLRSDLLSSAVLGLAGALWLFEGTRWVYRMIAIHYRLTNRRLLCTRGFRLPDTRAVDLTQITDVSVAQGPVERLLGVGRILVQAPGGRLRPLILEGVWNPQRIARMIRKRARQTRGGDQGLPFRVR